jgi:hypothetical protein
MDEVIMALIEDEDEGAGVCNSCGSETVNYLCDDCHERLQYLYYNEK